MQRVWRPQWREAISSRFAWLKANDMVKSNFNEVEKYNLILLSRTAKPHDRRCREYMKCKLLFYITVSAHNLIFPKHCNVEVISWTHTVPAHSGFVVIFMFLLFGGFMNLHNKF